jgi:hypothetical protein
MAGPVLLGGKKKGGGVATSTLVVLVVVGGLAGVGYLAYKKGILKIGQGSGTAMRARMIAARRARLRTMGYAV